MGILNRKIIIVAALLTFSNVGFSELDLTSIKMPLEYKVKAAYIYNFLRFVEWDDQPPGSHQPLTIGIIGQDQFTPSLIRALQNQMIEGRPIVLKLLNWPDQSEKLNLLYVARSEQDQIASLLENVQGKKVLTVSEIRRFLPQGGMVQIWNDNNRVKFGINTIAVERAHLKVSSQMLQYAQISD